MRRTLAAILGSVLLAGCAPATTTGPAAATIRPSPSAPAYDTAVLGDHPAAFWRMGEASGTVMTDSSTNHNDGSYEGDALLGQPGASPSGTAVLFDGKGGALVPSSPGLAFTSLTIELWLKKHGDAVYGVYAARNSDCSGNRACFHLLNHGALSQLEFRVIADPGAALASTKGLEIGTWYYVVATYDGATAKLYINGDLDSSLALPATPVTSADSWYIGRRADGFFARATIEDLALYPVALSADQVKAHWRAAGR